MLTTAKKIEVLIVWGTKPYRIAKITNVSEQTVRDIWNGKVEIGKIKLENAEKLAAHYDLIERNLSEAIATVDLLIHWLDPERQRLSGNQNLYNKLKREPFKVFEHLHKIALEPQYTAKLKEYDWYLMQIEQRINVIDVDIAYNVQLSDLHTYYMSAMRHQLVTKQEK